VDSTATIAAPRRIRTRDMLPRHLRAWDDRDRVWAVRARVPGLLAQMERRIELKHVKRLPGV
jgi:hypothetical protein